MITHKDNTSDEHQVFDTPEEQILHRKNMWVGSGKSFSKEIAVFEEGKFVNREIEIIPAVAKLIEEIVINSADEHIRTSNKSLRGWTLDKINIKLDKNGMLIVRDNGGITSKLHSSGQYPVEVVFGKLFSSSNYNDDEKRSVVGTNGVGSSICNLFSTRFHVISADGVNSVETTWINNKSEQLPVHVKATKEHFTLVEAQLDLERFDIEEIPEGIMQYINRLSIILAASNPGLEVTYNDETYKFNNFKEYVDMYGNAEIIGEKNKDWEIYIVPSCGTPQRFAIVNGAECNEGSHIRHLEGIIGRRVQKVLDKLKMSNVITSHMIKNEYTLFVNMKVDKPEYTSQSKTELTNEMSAIDNDGKKYMISISDKLTKQIQESFIITALQALFDERNDALKSKAIQRRAKELNKQSTKGIHKLLDAGESKLSKRNNCELWLFEGESAGLGFRPNRNPETQGCYFLKGKCVNSIHMQTINVLSNKEFSDIIVALGLDVRNPSALSKLRYGKIIISTDADVDGHSIVGQLLTLFAIHFPDLINQGFIFRSISPLHKAAKGSDVQYFYSTEDFDKFTDTHKGYKSSYFKGLGSLQKADYKVMIQQAKLEKFRIDENCIKILTAFMGSDSAPRKRLLEAQV